MASFDVGVSEAAMLLRRNGALTRAALMEQTGLSRSAINQRIDALAEAGLLTEGQAKASGRGRPATPLSFNNDLHRLLLVDLDVHQAHASLSDLGGRILVEEVVPADVGDRPEVVLKQILEVFDRLLDVAALQRRDVAGIGMSVPAPVNVKSGVAVAPPVMPLWNNYDLPRWFGSTYQCLTFVDKDANAMAYGEARTNFRVTDQLMLVKISTGIGSGMVHHGQPFRGADGAAGDIGHTRAPTQDERLGVLCKCGNTDCLEAYAGGWAMVRDLKASGIAIDSHADLLDLIRAGDPSTTALVRNAGRLIGTCIATAVNLLNPKVIVLAGSVAAAGGDNLVAGVREMVYKRSLPLATADLSILPSTLEPHAGLIGLAHLVTDELLHPSRIGALLHPVT